MKPHDAPLVVDLHMDTPTASLLDPAFRLGDRNPTGHVDLPRLREGGVDAAFFVTWVEPWWGAAPGGAFQRARSVLELTRREVAGADHVAAGCDFDGVGALPEGLGDADAPGEGACVGRSRTGGPGAPAP